MVKKLKQPKMFDNRVFEVLLVAHYESSSSVQPVSNVMMGVDIQITCNMYVKLVFTSYR